MAADLDARPGASEVFNVEFEGQESLSLPSREDPPNGGGDRNGIVHPGDEKIHGEAKDDGDGSYVFVDGADTVSDGPVDTECAEDPAEVAKENAIVEEETVSALNGSSLLEERQVKIEELKIEHKGNSECHSDENDVSLLEEHDLSSEFSQCQSNGNGVEKHYSVDEKKQLESAAKVEGDHEPLIMPDTAYGNKLLQSADEEKIEQENKSVAGLKVEEKQELPQSVDKEKIEEENRLEAVEEKEKFPQSVNDDKIEEEGKFKAAVTVEEQQLPRSSISDKLEEENMSEAAGTVEEELELPHSANEDNIEEDNKSGPFVTVEEKQEPEFMVTEGAEPLVLQVSTGEAKAEGHEVKEAVDHTVLQFSNGKAKAVSQDVCQTDIPDAVESKLNQLDNCGEKVEAEIIKLQPNEEAEKNQFDDKEEKVEEQSDPDSSADIVVDQGDETETLEGVETELHHLENGEKENGKFTAEVPLNIPIEQQEGENELIMDVAASSVDDVQLESEATNDTENRNGKSVPTFPVEEMVSEVEVTCSELAEVHEGRPARDANDTESEYKKRNGSVVYSNNFTADYWKTGIVFGDLPAANGVGMYGIPNERAVIEPEVENFSVERDEKSLSCSVDCERLESRTENGPVKNDHDEPTIPVDDPKMNCDSGNISSAMKNDDDVNEGSQLSDVSVSIGENTTESVKNSTDVDDEGSPSVGGDSDGKQGSDELDTGEEIESNGNSSSPIENSTIDPSEGQRVDEEAAKRLFFLIRIPRYLDDKMRNEIGLAQLQVDERTQSRDAIRSTIQLKRATCNEYRDKFEDARSEERAARDAFNTKRQEMDSVQSVLNRMKNATSIDDIDEKIQSMEHRIEHETVPLKEEKQLIREIKQLKHVREQLCASLGRQAEVQPSSEQKERIEERFKVLKQELDSARNEVLRAEGITRVAKKMYLDENEKLKELQGHFRAADDLRQEAYRQLQNLKKQLYDKNKYFRMYKEDVRKAEDCAFRGDKESLQQLCVNQVETIMDLWNKNDEFRNEYVRCNMNSTLRRFKTLDGRRLGPDEELPLLHGAVDEKVDNPVVASNKNNCTSLLSTSDQGVSVQLPVFKLADVNSVVNLENRDIDADIKSLVNQEQKTPTKSKKVIKKPIALEDNSATVSGREGIGENAEVSKKTLVEEELASKEEELRKEEAAAKLKEQQRLEEKAKAKEAEERKKRNAEKAQARAELRAKKEAELKEREREKRARKKERKRAAAAAAESTNGAAEEKSASVAEISQPEATHESEFQEKPTTVAKRPPKPSLLAKQSKTKGLPPPLRNRGRRRTQAWMWVLLAVVVVLALLYVGNGGYFKFANNSFGF